jgi:hypothetical protein
MSLPLTDLFRPRIRSRKGHWIHLNTAAEMMGCTPDDVFQILDLNEIVTSKQSSLCKSRIYLHEAWVGQYNDKNPLARYCLLQSQVKDDEMDNMVLDSMMYSLSSSRRKANPKRIRLLRHLSKSRYLSDSEVALLEPVLDETFLGKKRINGLLEYLNGATSKRDDGTTWKCSNGIINDRKRRHILAKQAVGSA